MITNYHRPARNTALTTIVAFALLAACGGPQPAPAEQINGTEPRKALRSSADSMHMLDSTFMRVMSLFADNFDAGAGQPILYTEQEIPYDSLAGAVPNDAALHGLHIDYGLSGDSLRLAFQLVQLDSTPEPNVFKYTAGDTVMEWNQGRSTLWNRAAWRSKYQYNTGSSGGYMNKVRIRRTPSAGFAPADTSMDTHASVLAWEMEVLQLRQQNEDHRDSTYYVVFSAIGRYDSADTLRHAMALHLRLRPTADPTAPGRDLLDNSYDPAQLLHMHAGDFGTLCPPNCAEYLLPPQ